MGPTANKTLANKRFERENTKIARGLEKFCADTKPATLLRYCETDERAEK